MDILYALLLVTVYSAVIFLAILLFKRVLGGRMSPRLHYALWLLLVLRLLLPVTPESPLRLITLPAVQAPSADAAVRAARETRVPGAPAAVTTGRSPAPQADAAAGAEAPANAQKPSAAPRVRLTVRQLHLLIWAVGAVSCLAYFAVLYALLLRRIRRKGGAPPQALTALLNEVVELV